MSSSELALEGPELSLEISAPNSPSSSQALALTANSSRCTSPQFSPPQFLNEDDDEEGEEGEEEEEDGDEDLRNLQNLQSLADLQDATDAPMEEEEEENVTSLNLSLSSKQQELNDSSANNSTSITASNNEHHQEEDDQELLLQQQLNSVNNRDNCSSRSSSCSRSSSGSVKQQELEQHEQQSSTSPAPPPLPAALTVANSNNNHSHFNQFAESHDLSSSSGISNNISASALAAAAAFRVGHNSNSHSSGKNFHHKSEGSSISRGKSSKSHLGSGSSGSQLSYAADYSSVPNPQSPEFVGILLEYRQVLLDMLAKTLTVNTDADYTAVGEGGDPKSVNLPLKCQCGFTSKLSNQVTRSSMYVHQLELRFRTLMEASRASEAKYTPKRPNYINSASQVFLGSKGLFSLLDKKAAHLSRQAASASAAAAAAASSAGKPVSLFAGRSGASSINSSLNGDDDEGDADSEEDDVNEEANLPGSLNFNGAANVGSLVEEMNGAGGGSAAAAAGGASGNAGGKTILEGYLESMKNHLHSEDGGSEEEDARKMMMVNQMGGGGRGDDNELDGLKRIDLPTKRIIVQMINSGISVSDISRNIGVSRKAVKQIVANFHAYGMHEKNRESRIQKASVQSHVIKLYAQGRSFSEISRATNISKPTISKIIKQYADSNPALSGQGPNGFMVQHNGGASALSNMKPHFGAGDALDDDMDDEEKEMVVDEDAGDEDDFDDDEDEEMAMKNAHASMLSSGAAFPLALTKQHAHQPPMKKQRAAMSLIHNSFNNGAFNLHGQQAPQQAHMNSNGNSSHQQQQLLQSQLSLLQERFNNSNGAGKPFDMKMRHSNHGGLPMMDALLSQSQHGHRKSSHIVPQSDNTAKLQALLRHQQQQQQQQQKQHQQQQQQLQQQQQQQQQHHMRMNSSSPRGENHHRMKSMKAMNHRLSNEMSIKESILSMPEADKNNNTTLANCNAMSISASGAPGGLTLNGNALAAMGGHLSNSSSGQHSPSESNPLMPPMSASMGDSNSDSESNMMARPFSDSFPAGIMNSLNPNRATKLTLEDFNVVWQLRSQHWTHNQIRKYFEQRGKSISKSSISRIMNGKQRNFQQFFNVIPSPL